MWPANDRSSCLLLALDLLSSFALLMIPYSLHSTQFKHAYLYFRKLIGCAEWAMVKIAEAVSAEFGSLRNYFVNLEYCVRSDENILCLCASVYCVASRGLAYSTIWFLVGTWTRVSCVLRCGKMAAAISFLAPYRTLYSKTRVLNLTNRSQYRCFTYAYLFQAWKSMRLTFSFDKFRMIFFLFE